ncbi:hypothetical protein GY45DRAFT_247298 [Cubamyces sp. BRFM 1775]|nr:hypothetical protein GY45DRAFT_247298 [Cubamyces sp. BRFM 1775]
MHAKPMRSVRRSLIVSLALRRLRVLSLDTSSQRPPTSAICARSLANGARTGDSGGAAHQSGCGGSCEVSGRSTGRPGRILGFSRVAQLRAHVTKGRPPLADAAR